MAFVLVCIASVKASRHAPTPNRRAIARLPMVAALVQVSLGAAVVRPVVPSIQA
jgi:hypothetical protein